MGRSGFAVAMLAFLSASPALGQYADVVQACREDAKLRCPTTQPGGGQVAECLKANFQALSEPCKAALVGVAAVRQACKADVAQQCPDIKPGAGRLLLCVRKHYAALSEPCRDAIGHAAERKVRTR